ncbi:MAG: hypothetical protein ACOC0V_04115, partial [Oceanicaulis sp.]
ATAAAFIAPASFAEPVGGAVFGIVEPVCEVSDAFADQEFASLTTGAIVNDTFDVQCNDADGALLRVKSANGGLINTDVPTGDPGRRVDYEARITTGVFSFAAPGQTDGTEDDQLIRATSTGSWSGVDNGLLEIELLGDAIYAGMYQDIILIELEAR